MFISNKIIRRPFVPILLILYLVLFYKLSGSQWWIFSTGYRFLIGEIILLIILKQGNLFKEDILFPRIFKGYALLLIINCITCYYFRGQSLLVSLLGWESFLLIFFYPIFKSWKISIEIWEHILYVLFIIILIGYILQNIFPNALIFALDKWRGYTEETRVRIYSDAILYLGTLYCWNKFLVFKKWKFLILYVIAFFIIFLQGYRILIASTLIVSIILYYRIYSFSKSIFFIILFLSISLYAVQYIPIVQNKVDEMINRTERDKDDGDNLVRLMNINYVYNEHFKSNTELFLGSGMPVLYIYRDETTGKSYVKESYSKYSKEMSELGAYNHFYTVDLGLWGLSWVAGIPFVLLFLYLLIRVIKLKVDPEYYYIGMYGLLVILCSATNALCYKHHNIIFLALALVIVDLANKKHHIKHL